MGFLDRYICVSLYFNDFTAADWVPSFWREVLRCTSELGRQVTHFDFGRYDGSGPRNGYKYIKRNEKYLRDPDASRQLKDLYFFSMETELNYFAPDMLLSATDELKLRPYRNTFMQCLCSDFQGQERFLAFVESYLRSMREVFDYRHGLVMPMRGDRYPHCYFIDMPTSPHLSERENAIAKILAKDNREYTQSVRDIYWGNVISAGHWGNDRARKGYLLSGLERLCEGNVSCIDENALFFRCPISIFALDAHQKAFDHWRHDVRVLMAECRIEIIAPEG